MHNARLPAIALLALVTGCQQHSAPADSSAPADITAASVNTRVPLPVESFEAYCFRTGANFDRVVAAAETMKFAPMPPEYEALLGPQQGSMSGYVVESDAKARTMVLLGASDSNTCSIAVDGYDVNAITERMIADYQLKLTVENDVGLQVTAMYIPGGTSKKMSEARRLGMIAITRAKDPSVGIITLAYLPPETVSALFPEA